MKTEKICYNCKNLCSYGYHHWGCRLTEETTSAQGSCQDFEEDV